MPVIALGAFALAFVAAAIIALVLVLAAPALGQVLKAALGNLPLIGGQVASAVDSALESLTNTVVGWADNTVRAMGEWLWAEGGAFWIYISQVTGTLTALHDGMWALKGEITGAYNGAVAYVNIVEGNIVQGMLDLQNNLLGVISSDVGAVYGYVNQVEANLIQGLITTQTNADIAIAGALNTAIGYVNQVEGNLIQGMITLQNNADATIAQAFNNAINYVNGTENDILQGMRDLQTNLQSEIDNVDQTLSAEIAQVAGSLGAQISSGISSAENYAAALGRTLGADITAVGTQAGQEAAQAEAGAIATAESAAQAGIASATQAIEGSVGQDLVGPWDALLPDAKAIIGALPLPVAAALGLPDALTQATPDTVTGVLELTVPLLGAVAHEVANCVVPTCDTLNPLAGILGTLEGDAFLAALLAFLAGAASDPSGAVTDAENVIVAPVQAASSGLLSLLGV